MTQARTVEELRSQAAVVLRDALRDVRDRHVTVEQAEEALLRLLGAYAARHHVLTGASRRPGGPDLPRPGAIAEPERAVTAARRQLLAAGDPEAEARARALLAAAEHGRGLVVVSDPEAAALSVMGTRGAGRSIPRE